MMRAIALIAILLGVTACGGSSGNDDEGAPCGPGGTCPSGLLCQASDQTCHARGVVDVIHIDDQGGGITVTPQSGEAPAAGGGPTAQVTAPSTAINGGTVRVTITADQDFNRVIVRVVGASGYYDITLPATVSSVELLLTLSQELGGSSVTFEYSVGNSSGVGAYQDVPTALVSVGTGDVQVSVSWDAETDVDLHVVDPSGEEIYYGHTSSASGGMLDLDSNAGCSIDHVKNENITWSTAPSGMYTVRLDYFDECTLAETNYVVTVKVKNQDAQTFTGTFTGAGDGGSQGSGIPITTFNVP
jgi:hypothetical protein